MKNLFILASILMNFGFVNAQAIVIAQDGNCSEEHDGEHLYKGRYTNSGDIIMTFDGKIPMCLFIIF